MENEKTFTFEEFEKKITEQTPHIKAKIHDLLDSLGEGGKYHIMAITRAVAEVANDFRTGYDQGYNAGRLQQIEANIIVFERLRDKLMKLETEEEDNEEEEADAQ